MSEQAYYRLDELLAMGITEGKLRYLIEQDQVTPVFFTHPERFILGGYLKNKFLGYAVAEYSGLMAINKSLIPELLTKGKVQSKHFQLLQKDRISIISNRYPYQVPLPNIYLESWQKYDLSRLDWEYYPAITMPTETTSFLHRLMDMFKPYGDSPQTENSELSRFAKDIPLLELVVQNRELRFFEICLGAADVSRISAPKNTQKPTLPSTKETTVREIDVLIMKVISASPNLRPAEIWEVLKTDVERNDRIFDINEILEEVGDFEMVWCDAAGVAKHLKKKSFFNLLKNLR
jgi:hypothetical protein